MSDGEEEIEEWYQKQVAALEAELAQVKAERKAEGLALRRALDAGVKAVAERDEALHRLERLVTAPAFIDDVDYPAAVASARAFLLSMREKADQ